MRPLIAVLVAGLLALPAGAQTTQPDPSAPAVAGARARQASSPMEQRFDAANTTRDGKLTLAQAKAAKIDPVVKNFEAIDRDHKGYVTKADIHAFRKANKGKMGQSG